MDSNNQSELEKAILTLREHSQESTTPAEALMIAEGAGAPDELIARLKALPQNEALDFDKLLNPAATSEGVSTKHTAQDTPSALDDVPDFDDGADTNFHEASVPYMHEYDQMEASGEYEPMDPHEALERDLEAQAGIQTDPELDDVGPGKKYDFGPMNPDPRTLDEQLNDLVSLRDLEPKVVRSFLSAVRDCHIEEGRRTIAFPTLKAMFDSFDIDEDHSLHDLINHYARMEENNPGQEIKIEDIFKHVSRTDQTLHAEQKILKSSQGQAPTKSTTTEGSSAGSSSAGDASASAAGSGGDGEEEDRERDRVPKPEGQPAQGQQQTSLGGAAVSAASGGIGAIGTMGTAAINQLGGLIHRGLDAVAASPRASEKAVAKVSDIANKRAQRMRERQDALAGPDGVRGLADAVDQMNAAYQSLTSGKNKPGLTAAKSVKLRDSMERAFQAASKLKAPGVLDSMHGAIKKSFKHQMERMDAIVDRMNHDPKVFGDPDIPKKEGLKELVEKLKELITAIFSMLRGKGRGNAPAAASPSP